MKDNFKDVKAKGLEKLPISLDKTIEQKIKGIKIMKVSNLTWKSVLVLVFVTVLKAVLNIWFDPAVTDAIMKVVYELLNLIQGVSVASALWGVRRSISGDYV